MLRFVTLLSAVSCALAAALPEGMLPQLEGRIVGGAPTTISSYPWQVSVQRDGSHQCGGSIYSENIIITAAHCLQYISASNLRIRAGSSYWNSGGVIIGVAAFLNHPDFSPNTIVNDIAVIRLSSSLKMSSSIKPIALASKAPPNGAAATVSGWGVMVSGSWELPSQLRAIDLKILSRSLCASSTYGYGPMVQPTMICAYAVGKAPCNCDSGGPLVSGGLLVGVVSWGQGCADPKYPSVYADVAVLRSWIESTAASI